MDKKIILLYSRIIAYSFSLFLIFILALLSLDVFSESTPPKEKIISFLIHLIPVLLIASTTYVGWKLKKENIAGLIFIILAISYYLLASNQLKNSLGFITIEIPLIIIGLAYLFSSHYEKKINMD